MTKPLRILVVVDDRDTVAAVATVLQEEDGFAVWVARTGEEALEVADELGFAADMLIVDLDLGPAIRGDQFVAAYRRRSVKAFRLIVLSGTPAAYEIGRSMRAAAIIPKPYNANELVKTMRILARSATLAGAPEDSNEDDRPAGERRGRMGRAPLLTPRQREVLDFVVRGLENKEIAARLRIGEQTVKEVASRLLRKFGVPNRAALVDLAARIEFTGADSIERSWLPQLFRESIVQIAILRGPELRFVAVNDSFARAVGGRQVIGLTLRDAFPEFAGTGHVELAEEVYATGLPFVAHEVPALWDSGNGVERTYTDGVLQPLRGDDHQVNGVAFFALDVTKQVRDRDSVGRSPIS